VISEPMTRKYGGLINAMISDNIPGYSTSRRAVRYEEDEVAILGEFMGRMQESGENRSGNASVPPPINVGAPLAIRTAESRGMSTTPAAVQKNPDPYQEILNGQKALVKNFVDKLKIHFDETYSSIESSSERIKLAWLAAGKDVEAQVEAISNEKERLVVKRTFGLEEDFYSTIPTKPRNPGERSPTSERAPALKPSVTGIKGYKDSVKAAKVLAEIETGKDYTTPNKYDFGHVGDSRKASLIDLAKDPAASSAVVTAGNTKGIEIDIESIQKDGVEVFNRLGRFLVQGGADGVEAEGEMSSPSKRFFRLGQNLVQGMANGVEEKTQEVTASGAPAPPPKGSPLAPPPTPGTSSLPQPKAKPSVGKRVADRILDSAPSKAVGKFLAKQSGIAVSDSKGEVFYDPNEDESTEFGRMTAEARRKRDRLPGGKDYAPPDPNASPLPSAVARQINTELRDKGFITDDLEQTALGVASGIVPVKVVDGKIDIGENSIDNLANVSPTANEAAEAGQVTAAAKDNRAAADQIAESNEDLAKTTEKSTKERQKSDKEIKKENARQNRQRNAGRALGALGTATMVAGMASQVDGKVGEIAGKVVGPLAALSGIIPMLAALPLPIAALVAVVGAVAFGFYKLNEHLQKTRKEARELAEGLGSGTKAMDRFANFAGTVTPTELMKERRQLPGINILPGKSTFGENFIQDESGKDFVKSVENGLQSLGRSSTARKIANQLGTAVASGILSVDQARGIALELGREINDFGFTIEVNGVLNELIGPNGENVLENPLKLAIDLVEGSSADIVGPGGTFETLKAQLSGDLTGSWLGNLTSLADREAKLAGELTAFTEQRQGVIDAFDVATSKRVEELREEGSQLRENGKLEEANAKIAEARNFEASRKIERASIISETGAPLSGVFDEIAAAEALVESQKSIFGYQMPIDGFSIAMGWVSEEAVEAKKLLDSVNQTIDQMGEIAKGRFEGTEMEGSVNKTIDAITRREVPIKTQMVFTSAIASGAMSAGFAMKFLESFDPTKEEDEKVYNIVTDLVFKYGEGAVTQIESILTDLRDVYGTDLDKKKELETEIIAAIGASSDSKQALDFFSKLASYSDKVSSVAIQFYAKNPGEIEKLESKLEDIQDYLDANGDLTIETAVEQKFITDQQAANLSKENAEFFEGLDKDQKFLYMQTFLTIFETIGEDKAGAWLTSQGESPSGRSRRGRRWSTEQIDRGRVGAAAEETKQFVDTISSAFKGLQDDTEDLGGSGGGESFDPLLKKLRDLRLATIDMKRGWDGMMQSLENVFKGGTQSINVFEGLSNQIRKMGVGENLIEMIVGMDPDEYNKRKKELFVFDKAGNIVGITSKLKNMNAAFNAIAIGEYVNSQQKFIENTRNQFAAINILTASGLSLAEAYELVQDEALAAAIALGASAAEIAEIIRLTKQVAELRKKNEREQERADAAKAVRKTNEEFEKQVQVLNKLGKEAGKYTDAQISALLSDGNLQTIFLDPQIDANALRQAIINAERKAEIELRVRLATTEGTRSVFEEGFSMAMDAFGRQEQQIELDFRAVIADDESLIRDVESQIAGIQFELDDYQAEIKRIEDQEEEINKAYDARFEALDKVAKANERIAAAQKSQLDIADALTRGDIAGAARAAQEARAQQAQSSQQSERERLESARDAQLARLTGRTGLNREQLELRIKELEDQIFNIEEDLLEPAQERIRIQEESRNAQIRSLEVLGKTREEWERIKNGIDMAEIAGWKFKEAMQQALDVVEKLMAAYPEIKPAPPPPPPPAPTSSGGGGGSSPAPTATVSPKPPSPLPVQTKTVAQTLGFGTTANLTAMQSVKQAEIKSGAYYATPTKTSVTSTSTPLKAPTTGTKLPAIKKSEGGIIRKAFGGMIVPKRMAMGGKAKGYPMGGLIPYRADGGFFKSLGSDTIPAMLTPGEFVVRRPAVRGFGVDNLEKINNGTYSSGSMYNYNLTVNVKSNSNPDVIARTVMKSIERVESQRVRGNRI
jgi:hypothetical protein